MKIEQPGQVEGPAALRQCNHPFQIVAATAKGLPLDRVWVDPQPQAHQVEATLAHRSQQIPLPNSVLIVRAEALEFSQCRYIRPADGQVVRCGGGPGAECSQHDQQ
ncbi:hypothetical protein D3C75_1111070 [compost metagenome]